MIDDHATGAEPLSEDLGLFGFDGDRDRWLDHFRLAAAAPSLGTIGPYEVLAEIDRGGQGVVYRARQPGLRREIALKRLRAGSLATSRMRQRFEREIEAVAALSHPNIVSVFAVDSVGGQPLLAMQWVDGRPVTAWSQGRSLTEVLRVFVDICLAVHHAHQRGIIHCDLKPTNILVTDESGLARPHVLDFGLARIVSDEAAEDGGFAGTPEYASPEQLEGRAADLDIRTDVYSLGVILRELLAGRDEQADGELAAITAMATAAQPDGRYSSVAALAEDVRRWSRHEPLSAMPRTRRYMLRKVVSRNRGACAASAAVFLVLLTFLGALILSRQHEARSRQVAEEVTAFLRQTLASASPSSGGGDLSLAQVLVETGHRAQTELADKPRVAAEVLETVGTTLVSLWQADEALPFLERAVALHRTHQGRQSEALGRTLAALGRALANTGQARAVEVQREALAIQLALHGEGHQQTAEARLRLGYALHRAQRPPDFTEAEAMFEQGLAVLRRTAGDPSREVASGLHNMGFMRLGQRRIDEGAQLYEQALAMFRQIGDLNDPYYVECLHGYTSVLMMQKRFAEAAIALDEAIPLVAESYGRQQLPWLLWRRARAHRELGSLDAAQQDLSRAFAQTLRSQAGAAAEADRWRTLELAERVEGAGAGGGWPLEEMIALAQPKEQRDLRGMLLELSRLMKSRGDADAAATIDERFGVKRPAARDQ